MLLIVSQGLGVLGVAAGLIGYLPQIGHLVGEKCSAGISRRAYVLWLTGSLLLLTHALMIPDGVFILLQSIGASLDAGVIFYATKYEGRVCPIHNSARAVVDSGHGTGNRLEPQDHAALIHGAARDGHAAPAA